MNKYLINKINEHRKSFTWATFFASVLLLIWLPIYIDKVSLNITSDWRSVIGGLMYLTHVIVSNYDIVVILTLLAIPMINVNRWIGKHVKNHVMALLLKVFAPVLLLVCSSYFAFIIRDDIGVYFVSALYLLAFAICYYGNTPKWMMVMAFALLLTCFAFWYFMSWTTYSDYFSVDYTFNHLMRRNMIENVWHSWYNSTVLAFLIYKLYEMIGRLYGANR
jgi:hypothetical protein